MKTFELIIISISLAMDAFSASVCKGLKERKFNLKNSLITGTYFGTFQAIMPIIGYYLGNFFSEKIKTIDHFLAFVLLFFIGISMLKEAKSSNYIDQSLKFKEMVILSIATSIDALVIGVTLSFLEVDLYLAIIIIGTTTLILTSIGYNIGTFFGIKYQKKAQIIGGLTLIFMGFKILIEHLF